MAAPGIRRGDFIYRDTLFVDLGSDRRHPRASVSDLKDLLMPKGAPPKDQVAHWYEAQLIHYGLPRVKNKNAAKVKLMNAISAKSLKVPMHVVQMEEGMKREYASAMRKAKKGGGDGDGEVVGKGKKRKADDGDSALGTKMSFTMSKDGKIRFDVERKAGGGGARSASKKAKTEPKPNTEATAAKKSTPAPKPKAATKPPAQSPGHVRPTLPRSTVPAAESATSSPRRVKQTARRSRPFTYPSSSTRPLEQSSQQIYDHTPASFNNHSYSIVSNEEDDEPPPPYDSLDFRDTCNPNPPGNRSSGGDVVQISGTYTLHVSIPSARPLAPRTLSLAIDHSSSSLWGTFHIGPKRGLIRMTNTSGLANGQTKTFGWRSEDENSSNKMKFGRGCDGTITFDGEGGVKGVFAGGMMYGEDVEFEGWLDDEDERPDVEDVEEGWEAFPRRAYGRG